MTEDKTETVPPGVPLPTIEAAAGPGEPCLAWTLSDETRAALREIDENIGMARARLAGFLVD